MRLLAQDCFQGICIALIAGEYATAEKLAKLIWDPPNASYIDVRSEVCTPNQQHLAYAVKQLLQNLLEAVEKELKQVRHHTKEEQVASMAKMVRGLAEKNEISFSEGLQELLCWHRKQVRNPYNQKDPEMYFCLPAMGLSILAVRGGMLKKTELPSAPYLPLELIPD